MLDEAFVLDADGFVGQRYLGALTAPQHGQRGARDAVRAEAEGTAQNGDALGALDGERGAVHRLVRGPARLDGDGDAGVGEQESARAVLHQVGCRAGGGGALATATAPVGGGAGVPEPVAGDGTQGGRHPGPPEQVETDVQQVPAEVEQGAAAGQPAIGEPAVTLRDPGRPGPVEAQCAQVAE
ncbi:hypothetical protein Sfulv_54390 [Streptomyces fulvorobeus]|uniref:Uncharacterized protein n=1 Tax=Streptomyces fulvorobeus TaxID=284028 RepID=A0A7J0CDY7_9ACTN|nr:hypothetical protein Sfulv_54390 [Streptomyces fulvorobeus]